MYRGPSCQSISSSPQPRDVEQLCASVCPRRRRRRRRLVFYFHVSPLLAGKGTVIYRER